MHIVLVRHGETDSNSHDRYWGASDIGLSSIGVKQAKKVAQYLVGQSFDFLYTSKLQRAWHSADVIGRELEIIPKRYSELNEVDFGQLEGLTFLEIESNYPDTCHCWQQWSLELAFPGGESFWQFNARVSRFVNQIRNLPSETSVLIVGHGGPFKLITCHLLGLDIKHWWQFYFSLGSISVIDIYKQGAVINLLNDTSYLQEVID